jgi:hypothetical protein
LASIHDLHRLWEWPLCCQTEETEKKRKEQKNFQNNKKEGSTLSLAFDGGSEGARATEHKKLEERQACARLEALRAERKWARRLYWLAGEADYFAGISL